MQGTPRTLKFPSLAALIAVVAVPAACGALFQEVVIDTSPPVDPWMKAVGDLNGDGMLDLVLSGRSGPLVWYENPSWTRRTISTATGSAGSSTDVTLGDVDGNGSLDVVLANGVWFANPLPGGDAELDVWARSQIDATTAHDVVLADLDLDGDLDLVKRNQGATGDVIRVFRQNQGATWTERTIPAPAGEGLELADLDLDGDPDIVIAGAWYENDGNPISGAWTKYTYSTAYTYPKVVVQVANLGGSSRPDIVLAPAEASGTHYRLSWFEAPANPRTIWPERVLENNIETVVHGLALADFDRDGRTDVAFAEMQQGADPDRVSVLFQNSSGVFSNVSLSSVGSHNIVAADLDGDGDADLFGANWNTASAPDGAKPRIWLNHAASAAAAPAAR